MLRQRYIRNAIQTDAFITSDFERSISNMVMSTVSGRETAKDLKVKHAEVTKSLEDVHQQADEDRFSAQVPPLRNFKARLTVSAPPVPR